MESRHPPSATQTIAYAFTHEEFDALDRDAVVYAYYGVPGSNPALAARCGTIGSVLALPIPIGSCAN